MTFVGFAFRLLAFAAALAVTSLIGVGDAKAQQHQASDPRVADLVPVGKLRVGVGLSLVGAVKDPANGELSGVAIDLARALATRIGVEMVPVLYPSPPRVMDGLKGVEWDVGIFAIDPARRDQVGFTPAYLQVDSTLLIRNDAAIEAFADADRPGVRIAVPRDSVEEILLRRQLKEAELVVVPTSAAGFERLRSGEANALAASRPTLLQFAAQLRGSRILQDRFGVIEVAFAVPNGHPERLTYVTEFIEAAKTSGLVSHAITRANLRGVQVAPR
jgi:polar amino acid transport system substrate-binding protein